MEIISELISTIEIWHITSWEDSCQQSVIRVQFPHFILYICLIVYFLLTLTGCDETFQSLQDNERHSFFIYGYLDASANTQWVRVTPVRMQLNQPPVKPEMHVTLDHPESGNTLVLNAIFPISVVLRIKE